MIKIIKSNNKDEIDFLNNLEARNEEVNDCIGKQVKKIIDEVKNTKDEALIKYTEKFDKVKLECLEVDRETINDALSIASADFVDAMLSAINNITDFHKRQVQQSYINAREDGVILGQTIRGLHKVGIYVPGGTAAYPSSVLMNAIPAKIAGVEEIIMVTPIGKDGKVNNDILVAAALCGVDRIFSVGGAQAIAALAYGTQSIPKVDKIVGPGNIYVATAKKLLYGVVDIDMIAGPSEILIIADENANPKYLAADMLSQAEHDVLASSILLINNEDTAKAVAIEIENQTQKLNRKNIINQSIDNYGAIIIYNNINTAINLANELAPEHLEVCLKNPMEYIGKLHNAGSIFLGDYSPEPLGDYYSGTNHVLPTGQTARFFSPLSVDSFIKKTSFTYYTKEALKLTKNHVSLIAYAEGLDAHANAVNIRFEDEIDG